MKAMLFADWMNIRRSMKALLWVFAVMAVSAFAYGGSAFIPFLVTMLSVMGPATLMSTDHAYGWDRLSLTLPVSRRDIVSSKFTVSLALNAAMFLLGVVLTMVFSAVHRDGSLAENLLGLLGCEAAALLLMGIEFDLILRFGTERGRYFLLGVVWVPIIALTALKNHPAFNRLVQAVGGMDSWPVSRLAAFLAGCLAVGVSGAKSLAWAANKPIYGINHVIGHIAVTQLQFGPFPKDTLALIVSGGHTSLLHVEDVARHIDVVGTTLDDAAGECFDKVARLLGFPYPGGPHIDRHAQLGNPHAIKVPQGLTQGKAGQQHPYDFSFSGVKTAVARWIEQQQAEGNEIPIDDVCASLADSVATVLAKKAMRGCEQYGSKTLIVGGGFSANSQLRAKLLEVGAKHGVEVRIPQIKLCTDNGAMVAMLGVNLVESGVEPSEPDFAIDSAMPLTKISM